MIKAPVSELKLPISGVTVFLREWINNGQLEYCEEPLQRLAERKITGVAENSSGPAAQQDAVSRGREVYTEKIVVPAEGETAEQTITEAAAIREFYSQLPSHDVNLVNEKINELDEANKKKLPVKDTSGPTPTVA